MKLEEEKRFALLLAAKDSDYVKKMYGGYFNVFVKAFGDEGELWDLFRVVEGEFPKVEDLNKYDGFVVSGSPHDAYGDDLWVTELCSLLQNLISMDKRVLGVCFGHQKDFAEEAKAKMEKEEDDDDRRFWEKQEEEKKAGEEIARALNMKKKKKKKKNKKKTVGIS
ncbi:uncharacterized protein A4U43_C05F25770 [Asparagus officinalis]|uniref:Glutamine amidotransferase domain-containing protein n=1 Tax=Asparagus officinalis TaxID=4686 RepID=A0A5P1EUH5_ASPOF|nr:uncharacterized protein A4U43_C05F25770 [Asparagus officinalis]